MVFFQGTSLAGLRVCQFLSSGCVLKLQPLRTHHDIINTILILLCKFAVCSL